ncbi:unnamed protein product [Caenorhabditis angaria]|uniref:Uncharacterized protein n=1 Tax=Caenorhabditis angaria TaxID=860376 RepID=A0A9P1J4P0_9PELO|nr:unnamed protein product [Caenorhabditis angaria]
MEPREPLSLQMLCNVKVMSQLSDIYLRRVMTEPKLPTREAVFFSGAVNKLSFNSKTQEQYKRLCAHYTRFLFEIGYTDFPSLKKDITFDVREIAMFMNEMKRKGFVVYNRREELPNHLTTFACFRELT